MAESASAFVYLPAGGGCGSLRGVPGEPLADDASGLRAANAGLRAVVEAKDAENALLRAELDAERELRKRLELRLAELERRLGMDSTDSGTPSLEGADRGEGGAAGPAAVRAGAQEGPQAGRAARSSGERPGTGSGSGRGEDRGAPCGVPFLQGGPGRRGDRGVRGGRRSSTRRSSGR